MANFVEDRIGETIRTAKRASDKTKAEECDTVIGGGEERQACEIPSVEVSEPLFEETAQTPTECEADDEIYESHPEETSYSEPENTGGCVGTYSITAYTATGNPMANGEYPYYGCVASCDFPLGTILYIEGIGTFVVNDVCPSSGVIDIYMDSYDECVNFGRMSANVYIQ